MSTSAKPMTTSSHSSWLDSSAERNTATAAACRICSIHSLVSRAITHYELSRILKISIPKLIFIMPIRKFLALISDVIKFGLEDPMILSQLQTLPLRLRCVALLLGLRPALPSCTLPACLLLARHRGVLPLSSLLLSICIIPRPGLHPLHPLLQQSLSIWNLLVMVSLRLITFHLWMTRNLMEKLKA